MDRVNVLTLQEGSIEGAGKAAFLETAFQKLLIDLTSINKTFTVDGIEDTGAFRDKVYALTLYSEKVMKDVELGKISESTLATFHQLAVQTAQAQVSLADESISVALLQKLYCEEFASIDLEVRERFDDVIDSMRQIGQDRGVDMLGSGQFSEFLEADLDSLSYLGSGIQCLTEALNGIDDVQTRQQISEIRADMISKKTNQDVAAVYSADQGRSDFITKAQAEIASIQKNAKTVESIVTALEQLAKDAGGLIAPTLESISSFSGNLDHLQVGAGGSLAEGLEEFSEHPNAGVPLCEPV